ncbi:hypothetical protein [uncultured Tissierella sp.]|uniref:hypothetical protein n=1 Tax=uncultured Tissierella sp. TaxID=448160 RepID=UPI002805C750|nr:hypothetical protein [uncultured Tissierella sp.]MDU5081222.1 hypothetical protein [Bacillota bacterium]
MKIELNENILSEEDKNVLVNFRRYRDYNTIRRNLREAYDLIDSIIELENNISKEYMLSEYQAEIISAKISFHYLIVLYARWFNATKGKSSLQKSKFFKGDTEYLLETHDYIMQLRNQYIAHNEKDLLGGDKVFLHVDSMDNITVSSDWKEQVIANRQTLEKIKKCIEVVHNIIDAEEIPKYESSLKEGLIEKKVVGKLVKNNINN